MESLAPAVVGSKQRTSKRKRSIVDANLAPHKYRKPNQPFRFLDLPGELRNRIYEYAAEDTSRTWPLIRVQTPKAKRILRSKPLSPSIVEEIPFPYLGFTQSCTQIRSEFRCLWMQGHRTFLNTLGRYLSTFYPNPRKKDIASEPYLGSTGKLRIIIRRSEILATSHDLLRLVKLKAKLSGYNFVFDHGFDVKPGILAGLNHMLNNTHPKWLRWVRANAIAEIRLDNCSIQPARVRIVVNERYASDWMKPMLIIQNERLAHLLESLGLNGMGNKDLRLTFGVRY
ncbi:hypothetical protein B0J11DRAFT_490320 [Dendryphion nanum]|uniref:F-box domain-containing protein n=1 Tax=Dendryphion nanum TaxID=256645 RepID=A0A9P9DK58_9PLEO|nr:hypothetical protein B0J11DRAFT_490320 [Dendryphion nanum]